MTTDRMGENFNTNGHSQNLNCFVVLYTLCIFYEDSLVSNQYLQQLKAPKGEKKTLPKMAEKGFLFFSHKVSWVFADRILRQCHRS